MIYLTGIKYNFDKNTLESLGVNIRYFNNYKNENHTLSFYKYPFMKEMYNKYSKYSSYEVFRTPEKSQKEVTFILNISTNYFTDIANTIKGLPVTIDTSFQSTIKKLFLTQIGSVNYDFSFDKDFDFHEPKNRFETKINECNNFLDLLGIISSYHINIKSDNQDDTYKEYVKNIENNIILNMISKLNEFFTWIFIYNYLPIYNHLAYTDHKDIELSDTFAANTISEYRKIVLENIHNRIAFQLFEEKTNKNDLDICDNITISKNNHKIKTEELILPNNFFIVLLNIISEVSSELNVKICVKFNTNNKCLCRQLYESGKAKQIYEYTKFNDIKLY